LAALAAALFIAAGVFYFVIGGGDETPTEQQSSSPSVSANQNGAGNGQGTEPPSPNVPAQATASPGINVTVPNMEGRQLAALESAFNLLGLVPEIRYVEDDRAQDTVIWVARAGEEVPRQTALEVHVSAGRPFIRIDNPRIVITSGFNASSRAFQSRTAEANGVAAAGGVPILPADDALLADALRYGNSANAETIAALYDGLILTGGGDIAAHLFGQAHHFASGTPDLNRDIAEIALAQAFINAGKPVFGMNRGMQIINVAMGGDLIQDIPDLLGISSNVHSDGGRHTMLIENGTWLFDMYGSSLETYSFHHQAIGRLADGFTVVARVGQVIEAIQRGNVLGVQFSLLRLSDEGAGLYADFIDRCSYVPIR